MLMAGPKSAAVIEPPPATTPATKAATSPATQGGGNESGGKTQGPSKQSGQLKSPGEQVLAALVEPTNAATWQPEQWHAVQAPMVAPVTLSPPPAVAMFSCGTIMLGMTPTGAPAGTLPNVVAQGNMPTVFSVGVNGAVQLPNGVKVP
jgi:hypothetical protein